LGKRACGDGSLIEVRAHFCLQTGDRYRRLVEKDWKCAGQEKCFLWVAKECSGWITKEDKLWLDLLFHHPWCPDIMVNNCPWPL
jgi:hypothetical protein